MNKRIRKTLAIATGVATISGVVIPAVVSHADSVHKVDNVAKSKETLYTKGVINTNINGATPKYDMANIVGSNGNMYKVCTQQGTIMEVPKSEITMVESGVTNPLVSINQVDQVIHVTTSLNVRKLPTTNSEVINSLHEGQTIKVVGREGEWFKVTVDGQEGFVYDMFVHKTDATMGNTTTSGAIGVMKHHERQSNIKRATKENYHHSLNRAKKEAKSNTVANSNNTENHNKVDGIISNGNNIKPNIVKPVVNPTPVVKPVVNPTHHTDVKPAVNPTPAIKPDVKPIHHTNVNPTPAVKPDVNPTPVVKPDVKPVKPVEPTHHTDVKPVVKPVQPEHHNTKPDVKPDVKPVQPEHHDVKPIPVVKPVVKPDVKPTPVVKPIHHTDVKPAPVVKPDVKPAVKPTPVVKPERHTDVKPTPVVKPDVKPTPVVKPVVKPVIKHSVVKLSYMLNGKQISSTSVNKEVGSSLSTIQIPNSISSKYNIKDILFDGKDIGTSLNGEVVDGANNVVINLELKATKPQNGKILVEMINQKTGKVMFSQVYTGKVGTSTEYVQQACPEDYVMTKVTVDGNVVETAATPGFLHSLEFTGKEQTVIWYVKKVECTLTYNIYGPNGKLLDTFTKATKTGNEGGYTDIPTKYLKGRHVSHWTWNGEAGNDPYAFGQPNPGKNVCDVWLANGPAPTYHGNETVVPLKNVQPEYPANPTPPTGGWNISDAGFHQAVANDFYKLVNEQRGKCNAQAQKDKENYTVYYNQINLTDIKAAEWKANELCKTGDFSHLTPQGLGTSQIPGFESCVGENILSISFVKDSNLSEIDAQKLASQFFNMWMSSVLHRGTLETNSSKGMGFAFKVAKDGAVYAVYENNGLLLWF